jgi:hypothetical protein
MTRPKSVARVPVPSAHLLADRKRVSELFAAYDEANSPERKEKCVAQMRMELTVSADVEEELEEIFYPALSAGAGTH